MPSQLLFTFSISTITSYRSVVFRARSSPPSSFGRVGSSLEPPMIAPTAGRRHLALVYKIQIGTRIIDCFWILNSLDYVRNMSSSSWFYRLPFPNLIQLFSAGNTTWKASPLIFTIGFELAVKALFLYIIWIPILPLTKKWNHKLISTSFDMPCSQSH
jgi:hypothetical protein